MKISYEACRRSITLIELFVNSILKAYKKLYYDEVREALMTPEDEDLPKKDGSFEENELIFKEPLM